MKYRELPALGRDIPVIGFGTGDNAGLMVAGDERDQRLAVERALELGINYFDTAPDYGQGQAEENLGAALHGIGAPVVLCTKVEVWFGDLDDIAGRVVRSVEGSLQRLGVERLDIVQIHNAPASVRAPHTPRWGALEAGDFLGQGGALEGLERLRAQGKVNVFGFTCAHADASVVRTLLDTDAFGMINVWYNILNPTAGVRLVPGLEVDRDYEEIIGYAASRSVAVAAFRPLAGGALTSQATEGLGRHRLAGGQLTDRPALLQPDLARARHLAGVLDVDGQELTRLAYRFVLDQPTVTTVLGGFSDLGQLESVAELADAPSLSDTEHDELRRAWESNFDLPEGLTT